MDSIKYRVATVDDHNEILELIRKHYYPEEPITIGNAPKEQSAEDEEFSMCTLHLGTSVVAYDENNQNKIIGCCISGPINANDADDMIEQSKLCKSKKWSEILQLLAYLENTANVCKRFDVIKSLHMHVLAVDGMARGKSIGVKLMDKCMENAKHLGYKLASTDCTSVYSIRIAEKLNMNCINVLAYANYVDEQGRQLFRPPLPHTHIKTYVKFL